MVDLGPCPISTDWWMGKDGERASRDELDEGEGGGGRGGKKAEPREDCARGDGELAGGLARGDHGAWDRLYARDRQ